ncbi:MAG: homogentisate 1,2-dioxygenase [Rubrivivax sp.]
MDALDTLNGFGNLFSNEAVSCAVPVGRNSPQRGAHCLLVERLSGSAFTAPRAENRRTWVYCRRTSWSARRASISRAAGASTSVHGHSAKAHAMPAAPTAGPCCKTTSRLDHARSHT